MKKFLQWFFGVVAFLAAVFIIGGFMLPSTWSVKEEINIVGEPSIIYEQIANLRNWQNWSPWTKEKDPTQIYSYEGPEMGAGAKWLWTSQKMGQGFLEIKKADLNSGIAYELFIDMNGSKSTILGSITYAPTNNALKVTWIDSGEADSLFKKWMSLLIKNMLGKEMREGLEKLKKITAKK